MNLSLRNGTTLLVFLMLMVSCQTNDFEPRVSIVPKPDRLIQKEGFFSIDAHTKLIAKEGCAENLIKQYIKQ